LAELVLVIFGFILLWRQRNIRQEFAELEKRNAARTDALRRELQELRHKIDGAAGGLVAAPSVVTTPRASPAPELHHRAAVHLVDDMAPAARPVTILPAPSAPEAQARKIGGIDT